MKRLHLLLVAGSALFLGATGLSASTISLSVVPSLTNVNSGNLVSAAIEIQGLQGNAPNGPSLGAYEVTLSWDTLILGSPVVSFGDPGLGDQLALTVPSITCIGTACGAASTFPLTIGEVSLDPVSVLNGSQPAAFTLATVNFQALASGSTSSLALSDIVLSDASGNSLLVGGGALPGGGAVPEPRAGVLILAAGLAGLFVRRQWASARA